MREAVDEALALLDRGEVRVAEKTGGALGRQPVAEEGGAALLPAQPDGADRGRAGRRGVVGQGAVEVRRLERESISSNAGFRAVPGAIVRRSAYIAPGVVLMPSFVNLGAYVDSGTMVDTWATVGSCAQIGKNVPSLRRRRHRRRARAAAGRARPSSRTTASSARARRWSRASSSAKARCISMGVFIGASTKIVDRATGEVHMGRVPPYSVVVSGTLPGKPLPERRAGPVALLRGDRQEGRREDPRRRPSINELLRD